MDNSAEKQSTKKTWITDGVIVAAIPVSAYILLYSYEVGFIDSFKIPREFMSIELPSVVAIGFGTLVLIVIGMFLIIPLIRSEVNIVRKIGWTLFFGVISLPTFLLSLMKTSKIFSAIFLVICFMVLVSFFKPRKEITIIESLKRHLGDELVSFIPIFLLLLSGGTLMNVMGRVDAQTKNEFLVIKNSQEMVVLRIYGDKLICAPFDRTTKEVKKTFIILKTGNDPNLQLSLEKVGPLHVEKQTVEVLKKSIGATNDSLEGLNKK